jgi:hypothetical protein
MGEVVFLCSAPDQRRLAILPLLIGSARRLRRPSLPPLSGGSRSGLPRIQGVVAATGAPTPAARILMSSAATSLGDARARNRLGRQPQAQAQSSRLRSRGRAPDLRTDPRSPIPIPTRIRPDFSCTTRPVSSVTPLLRPPPAPDPEALALHLFSPALSPRILALALAPDPRPCPSLLLSLALASICPKVTSLSCPKP